MRIDVRQALLFIAEIMQEIRNSPSITSNQSQANAMGLSYGTVRNLLDPDFSIKNLPDAPTLDAIAAYRNQRLSDLFRELEDNCSQEISLEASKRAEIANAYRLDNIEDLIEVNTAVSAHLNHIYQLQKQEQVNENN